jgi:hypothetical protein
MVHSASVPLSPGAVKPTLAGKIDNNIANAIRVGSTLFFKFRMKISSLILHPGLIIDSAPGCSIPVFCDRFYLVSNDQFSYRYYFIFNYIQAKHFINNLF